MQLYHGATFPIESILYDPHDPCQQEEFQKRKLESAKRLHALKRKYLKAFYTEFEEIFK